VKVNAAGAEGTEVAEGDRAAGDAAEQPGSTVTMHRKAAEMIDSFASIR
jgi:hypothetical protein